MISYDRCRVDLENMLIVRGLKVTRQRIALLSCFHDGKRAATYHDIHDQVVSQINRVSIYRILDLLIEQNLIFSIVSTDGNKYYILNHYCFSKTDLVSLVKCECCHTVNLLPPPPVSYQDVLRQYHVRPRMLFIGLCEKCKK